MWCSLETLYELTFGIMCFTRLSVEACIVLYLQKLYFVKMWELFIIELVWKWNSQEDKEFLD